MSTERAKTDVPTKDMCRERKVQEKILIEQCVPTELQKKNQRREKYRNKSENKSLSAQTHTPPYPPLVSLTNTHFHVLWETKRGWWGPCSVAGSELRWPEICSSWGASFHDRRGTALILHATFVLYFKVAHFFLQKTDIFFLGHWRSPCFGVTQKWFFSEFSTKFWSASDSRSVSLWERDHFWTLYWK